MPTVRRLYTNEFIDYIIAILTTFQTSLGLNQIQRGNPRFLAPDDLLATLDAVYLIPIKTLCDWGPRVQSVTTEYDIRVLYLRLIGTDGTDDCARATISNVEQMCEVILDNKNFPTLGSMFPSLGIAPLGTSPYPNSGLLPDQMGVFSIDYNPPELKQLADLQIGVDGASFNIKVSAVAYKNTL